MDLVDTELDVWRISAAAAGSGSPADGPLRQWNVEMRNSPFSPVRRRQQRKGTATPNLSSAEAPLCRICCPGRRLSLASPDSTLPSPGGATRASIHPRQESFPASPTPDWSGPAFSSLDPYVRPWTLAVAAPDPLCAARETCAQCLTTDISSQVVWQVPNATLGGGIVALMDVDDFACYQTYAQYTTAAAGAGASAVLVHYTSQYVRGARREHCRNPESR